MKQTLENILVWALTKLNIERLKNLTIDDNRIVIGISKYVKDDGKWHHIAVSVSTWIKKDTKPKENTYYDETSVYLDGERKRRTKGLRKPVKE